MIKIYSPSNVELYTMNNIYKGCIVKRELMKHDYVVLKFSTFHPIIFETGCYVTINGKKYRTVEKKSPAYNKVTGGYDHSIQFDAWYYGWKNKQIKYSPANESGFTEISFKLTADISTHLAVLESNIQNCGLENCEVSFNAPDIPLASEHKLIDYNCVSILDAITMIANKFECEWWVSDNTLHFGTCNIGTSFELNEGNIDTYSVSSSDNSYANKIFVFGGTKNIPKDYRKEDFDATDILEAIVQRHLMLPDGMPYLMSDNSVSDAEIVEKTVVFEDIFPMFTSTVKSVSSYRPSEGEEIEEGGQEAASDAVYYRFTYNNLTWSNDFLLEGETLKIHFTSGSLNGLEFELAFNPNGEPEKITDENGNEVDNPDAQMFEVVANDTYGLTLPNESLHPNINDSFYLIGWDASKMGNTGLVGDAESRLLAAGQNYLSKITGNNQTYNVTCKSNQSNDLVVGTPISLVLRDKTVDNLRIIGYEKNLDIPWDKPKYVVGEDSSYSAINSLRKQLNGVTVTGDVVQIGGTSGEYLSKKIDDTAQGKITFNRGIKSLALSVFGTHKYEVIEVDEDGNPILDDDGNEVKKKTIYDGQRITEGGNIVTGDFNGGALGSGSFLGRYRDTHDTYLELDRLFVRKKAQFTELEIDELSHVGGEILLTLAAADCIAVEKWGTSSLNSELHVITDEELANSNLIDPETGEISKDVENPNLPTVSIEFFRCYMNLDDGEKEIENRFRMYDQVICQEFNIDSEGHYENISNKFYWRLVVGGGDGYNYIDLSNRIREDNVVGGNEIRSLRGFVQGSDIPEAGDTMVQLGNRTNKDRRNAIIISTYGAYSPSISKYAGIRDFNTGEEYLVSFDGFEGDTQMLKQFGSFFFGDKGDDPVEYIRFTHSDRKEGRHGTLEICASSITLVSGDTKESIIETFDKLNGDVKKIKEQNDKEYTIWFGDYVPTLSNEPASNWSPEEYSEHEQDIMYDKEHGFAYRFENTGDEDNPNYEWVEITDAETIRALELVKKKSTVHFQDSLEGIEPPYNVGDTWSNATYYARDEEGNVIYDPVLDENGNPSFYPNGDPKVEARIQYDNDFLVCVNAKGVGDKFDINDWRPTNWFSRAIFNQEKDQITQSVTNMVQLSKEDQKKYADELAEKTKNEAEKALKYALYGDEEKDDVKNSVFYNISVAKQTADAIVNAVGGLDKDGNLTEQTSLVLKSNFASIFTAAYNENGLPIKKADIDTFIKKDKNGNIESGIKLSADQIDFSGKKINLSADEVNVDANAININGEELPDYISSFYNGNEITAPISGGISGFLQVADGTALTWTNGILTSAR